MTPNTLVLPPGNERTICRRGRPQPRRRTATRQLHVGRVGHDAGCPNRKGRTRAARAADRLRRRGGQAEIGDHERQLAANSLELPPPPIYDICRIDIYEKSRRLPRVKPKAKKPTNAEVAILRVLWSRGPSTVREVAKAMGREAAYTTILKLMQNMTEKRLVVRDESSRTHVYSAASPEEQTQRQLVTDMLDKVFNGSAAQADHARTGGDRHVAERTGWNPETAGQTSRRPPMNAPMQAWMLVTGWTLIHFVWQGGLLAVATAAGLRLCRRRSSTTRYAVACLGLTAMLAAPAVTSAVLWEPAWSRCRLQDRQRSDPGEGHRLHDAADGAG